MRKFIQRTRNLPAHILIILIVTLSTLTGCGGQPEPTPVPVAIEPPTISEPKISAPTPQEPGQEIGISVDVSSASGVSLTYEWQADGGDIVRGDGSPAITYRTPAEPGIYNVRVTVKWDTSSVEKVTTIRVEAPEPDTPTPEPPTDTPTPEPDEPSPTATTPPPTSTLEPTATLVPATATPVPATNTPTATSIPPTPTLEITDTKSEQMVLIPAGEFVLGEEPAQTVTLDTFYIDKYEVTNEQYAACVQTGNCPPPQETGSRTRSNYYDNPEYDDYPVLFTTEGIYAQSYCEWRGGRLPTNAEWEKAARGTDGRQYPWGNEFDGNRVNFCDKNCSFDRADQNYDDGYEDTAPVGSFPDGVSPYGVYDMAGNAWELTSDNNTDLSSIVLRGGGSGTSGDYVRASYHLDPEDRGIRFGFRCVTEG